MRAQKFFRDFSVRKKQFLVRFKAGKSRFCGGYLQKPIVERQLEEALCSAEEQIRKRYLYLDTGHKKSVKLQDIIYIEAIHNRSYIMTKKEEIEIRIPMKNLCAKLPKEDFVPVSYTHLTLPTN